MAIFFSDIDPNGAGIGLAQSDANENTKEAVNAYNQALYGRTVIIPRGVAQISAFAFDYRGDEEVNIDTDITDHSLEDNTQIQDHIGVKPIIVTVRGFQAELNLSATQLAFINKAFSTVTNALSQVPSYLGSYTPGAVDAIQKAISQAQNIAIQIEQAAARTAQIASFFGGGTTITRQQQAYFELSSLALARTIFTVATPFQVFNNMAIQSMRVVQPKETRGWSDFTVKMKQLTFAKSVSLPFFTANNAGRTASQAQSTAQNGPTQGTEAPLTNVTNAFSTPGATA